VRLEFLFKRGYANFMDGHMDAAQTDFAQVKDQPGVFGPPATYYTAHIHYVQRNYAAALEGLTKLKDDPDFGAVVPYYIAQVQFLQGHYDALLEYVQPCSPTRTGPSAPATSTAWRVRPISAPDSTKALPYLEKACSAPVWSAATATSPAMPTTRTGSGKRPLPSSLPW
jgi:hypothetical protein